MGSSNRQGLAIGTALSPGMLVLSPVLLARRRTGEVEADLKGRAHEVCLLPSGIHAGAWRIHDGLVGGLPDVSSRPFRCMIRFFNSCAAAAAAACAAAARCSSWLA